MNISNWNELMKFKACKSIPTPICLALLNCHFNCIDKLFKFNYVCSCSRLNAFA